MIPPRHNMKTTQCEGFEKVWYMAYYFRWPTSDYVSRQIMDFKRGDIPPKEAFSEMAAEEFTLLGHKFDYVTRVLSSKELVALKGNKVAAIAHSIYEVCNAHYHPNLVQKNRMTKELKGLNKDQRKAELEGVYEIYQPVDLNHKSVLVVDDVFTFGTSLEAIAEVLKKENPHVKLYGFAIAHNWRRGQDGIMINETGFIGRYNKGFSHAA